jgi:CRISPR-associated exonuclease Cas4
MPHIAVPPIYVEQGRNFERRQQLLSRSRTLMRFGVDEGSLYFNQPVRSESLKLHGIVDAVLLTKGDVSPIEMKLEAKNPARGHLLQLAAYGMLLEEKFERPANVGFIMTGKEGRVIPVINLRDYRAEVADIVTTILGDLELGLLPPTRATMAKCEQCEYLAFCNDRE